MPGSGSLAIGFRNPSMVSGISRAECFSTLSDDSSALPFQVCKTNVTQFDVGGGVLFFTDWTHMGSPFNLSEVQDY